MGEFFRLAMQDQILIIVDDFGPPTFVVANMLPKTVACLYLTQLYEADVMFAVASEDLFGGTYNKFGLVHSKKGKAKDANTIHY